jgi:hypothetical protein
LFVLELLAKNANIYDRDLAAFGLFGHLSSG